MTEKAFKTRSMSVAIYILAAGSPFPSLLEGEGGRFSFSFDDPEGTWRQAADELDLRDTDSEKCSIPVARIFMSQRLLKDAISEARGKKV